MSGGEPEDEDPLFPCLVCDEESDSMICDECWERYKTQAGLVNGEDE